MTDNMKQINNHHNKDKETRHGYINTQEWTRRNRALCVCLRERERLVQWVSERAREGTNGQRWAVREFFCFVFPSLLNVSISYKPGRDGRVSEQLSLDVKFFHNMGGPCTLLSLLLQDRVQCFPSLAYFFGKLVIHPKVFPFQLPSLVLNKFFLLEMFKLCNGGTGLCSAEGSKSVYAVESNFFYQYLAGV